MVRETLWKSYPASLPPKVASLRCSVSAITRYQPMPPAIDCSRLSRALSSHLPWTAARHPRERVAHLHGGRSAFEGEGGSARSSSRCRRRAVGRATTRSSWVASSCRSAPIAQRCARSRSPARRSSTCGRSGSSANADAPRVRGRATSAGWPGWWSRDAPSSADSSAAAPSGGSLLRYRRGFLAEGSMGRSLARRSTPHSAHWNPLRSECTLHRSQRDRSRHGAAHEHSVHSSNGGNHG